MQEETTIADKLTCEACQRLADGTQFYKITKSFRTTVEGRHTPVIWRPPLVCRVSTKALPGLQGEWGYTRHAMLEHPEERGAYCPLCLHPDRIVAR